MSFKYSCFISYRHVQEELGQRFIEKFVEALKSHLELELDDEIGIYLDKDRMKPGYLFNEALSEAICQSICMIVIFTPKYFSQAKTYCTREYLAMKRLEEARLSTLKDRKLGLIVPVVLRGGDLLPSEIRDERHFFDFSKYSLINPDMLRHEEFNRYIAEIANYIREVHEAMEKVDVDLVNGCDEFRLPASEEVIPWLTKIKSPKPTFPGY